MCARWSVKDVALHLLGDEIGILSRKRDAFTTIESAEGTALSLAITGDAGGTWALLRERGRWVLYAGDVAEADAKVLLDQETAWRLFTKGIGLAEARARAILAGDEALGRKALDTVSVIA